MISLILLALTSFALGLLSGVTVALHVRTQLRALEARLKRVEPRRTGVVQEMGKSFNPAQNSAPRTSGVVRPRPPRPDDAGKADLLATVRGRTR